MGEAVYYMTIRFPKGVGTKVMPEIQEFLRQGVKAYDFWQDNRGRKNRKSFWKDFEAHFPMIADYLKTSLPSVWGKDHNNGLAGNLSFGELDDIEHMSLKQTGKGDELNYSAMVWHFADWGHLTKYVREKWGGLKEGWVSDEYKYIDGSMWPKLENYKEIVSDLLEKAEILPTLMGINKELDELIAETLKKPL